MKLITHNPYRIAGVLAGATAGAIQRQKSKAIQNINLSVKAFISTIVFGNLYSTKAYMQYTVKCNKQQIPIPCLRYIIYAANLHKNRQKTHTIQTLLKHVRIATTVYYTLVVGLHAKKIDNFGIC